MSNLHDHYGVNFKQGYTSFKDILIDLIKYGNMHDVLDKHFPKLSAEDRCKVHQYAIAFTALEKMGLK